MQVEVWLDVFDIGTKVESKAEEHIVGTVQPRYPT